MDIRNIDLIHLRAFVEVCDHNHFRRAADALCITQSALSKRVSSLENQLGVCLLDRNSKSLRRTSAGEFLYRRSAQLLEDFDELFTQTCNAAEGSAGVIRIAYSGAAMGTFLAAALKCLRKSLPDLQINLTEGPSQKQIQLLQDRQVDIAFPLFEPTASNLMNRPIDAVTVSIVLGGDHPLANEEEIALSSLAVENFILFPRKLNPTLYDNIILSCHAAGFTPNITKEVSPREAAIALVAMGEGITFLTNKLEHLAICGTVHRRLSPPAPALQFVATYQNDNSLLVERWLDAMFTTK